MHTMREFSRHLSRFKRLAQAGKTIRLVDRQGKHFKFEAEKPRRAFGAGRDLKGKPLSAEPIARDEFKAGY